MLFLAISVAEPEPDPDPNRTGVILPRSEPEPRSCCRFPVPALVPVPGIKRSQMWF